MWYLAVEQSHPKKRFAVFPHNVGFCVIYCWSRFSSVCCNTHTFGAAETSRRPASLAAKRALSLVQPADQSARLEEKHRRGHVLVCVRRTDPTAELRESVAQRTRAKGNRSATPPPCFWIGFGDPVGSCWQKRLFPRTGGKFYTCSRTLLYWYSQKQWLFLVYKGT